MSARYGAVEKCFLIVALCLCLAPSSVLGAEIPRAAPDLEVPLSGGGKIQLDQYRGQVVALEFLLTTCSHCKRTSKVMQKMYESLGDRGFQPIGVAVNAGSEKQVPGYILMNGLTYPVGYSDLYAAARFLQHSVMKLVLFPQIVFIDKKGTIRAHYSGSDAFFTNEEANMRSELEKLLSE